MVASGRVSNVKIYQIKHDEPLWRLLVSEGAVEISSDNALFNSS